MNIRILESYFTHCQRNRKEPSFTGLKQYKEDYKMVAKLMNQ